jgi:hypothetical protein
MPSAVKSSFNYTQFTDLSHEIIHLNSRISDKTSFHASNRRSLLSEFNSDSLTVFMVSSHSVIKSLEYLKYQAMLNLLFENRRF